MSRYSNISISRRWLNDLWRDHPQLVKTEKANHGGSLRFGQRVINELQAPVVLPEAFYEQNDEKAYQIIEQNFYIVEDQ